MSADLSKPVLETGAVEAALAGHGFGVDRGSAGAAILALLDPPHVVWANRAATQLFGSTDAADLDAQIFAGRGREGLGASVGRLPQDGSPRIERLRLIRGFRSRTLTVLVNQTRLDDGRVVVAISAPGHDLPGETADFGLSALKAPAPPAPSADVRRAPTQANPAGAATAPVAPAAAASDSADGIDPALRERLAATTPTRVLWQTDADHRLVKLTQGVADMAGIDDIALLGRPFADVIGELGAAEHGRLAAALDARAPFGGLDVAWPLSGAPVTVPVVLGALPMMTRAGFAGFRGFGVVDLTRPRPIVVEALPAAEPMQDNRPASPPADASPSAVVSTAAAEPPLATIAHEDAAAPLELMASEEVPAASSETMPRSFAPSGKVVSLRPYQSFTGFGPAAGAAPPADPPTALPPAVSDVDDHDDVLDLSLIERSNFQEIGRTLRSREPGGEPAPAPTVAPAASSPVSPASATAEAPGVASLLDAVSVALLVADGDRLLQANSAFAGLTGYGSLEALRAAGGLPHLFGGLDPRGVLVADHDRAVPLIGAAGDVLGLDGRLQPIAWGDGSADLISLRPTLGRSAAAAEPDERDHRRDTDLAEARALLDHAEPLLVSDRQGRILSANPAARRLFGLAEGPLDGATMVALLGVEAQAALARSDASDDGLDVIGRTAEGRMVPLRMRVRALTPQKIGISLRGQGDSASLNRELAETRERLERAMADKPDLLAKISHEIRTPLNAILGFAEVILDERFGPIGNARYKAYLRDIHESGTNVLGLVNDMLDLSNMEAGRLDMHPTAIDVNRVVGECVGELQSTAHRERVILRLSLLPHLSAALVDERAFRQIVGNILSNAINFNEPGGQVIVSTAMNETGAVAVRIRDTGIGMTESEIAMAMEPFRQIKAAKPGTGNGLGLPLARALVEANGATLSIRSRKEEGTLVEIVLPSCPAEPMRMPA